MVAVMNQLRYVANHSHYQFYKTRMLFNFTCVSTRESEAKVKYFSCNIDRLLHVGYVQKVYFM